MQGKVFEWSELRKNDKERTVGAKGAFSAQYKWLFLRNMVFELHKQIRWRHGNDVITVHPSLSSQQKEYSNINKQNKRKHIKAKWHPLQYSAGFFVLEGIVWGGNAHEERVVSSMFMAVVH